MNLWRLILRELSHRKLNFLLGLLSVSTAVTCLVGAFALLRGDRLQTEILLAEKEKAVSQAGAELEDAMRKITIGLGFNVIILPEDQDLNEMHLEGTLSKTMPESFVDRLANSDIVTINHLLPTIIKKLTWPEKQLPVIVYGTRGEVPQLHRDPKKPLLDAVARGRMIAGFRIAKELQLKPGDTVPLMGRQFAILKVHEERGTVDDSTVWINLAEAQELLGLQNLIHAIQALECHCAGDRITQIRQEIGGILPGTQVIERGPPALARAEARQKTKEAAEAALEREQAARVQHHQQREKLAGTLVPGVLLGAAIWIGFLALNNVRQRREEIGILRAIGFRSGQILAIFIGKALLMGALGALVGCLAGVGVGLWWGQAHLPPGMAASVLNVEILVLGLALAPFLSLLASWLPALQAARQDPALVLQSD